MRKDIVLALNLQNNFFHPNGSSFMGEDALARLSLIKDFLGGLDQSKSALIYSFDIRAPQDKFYETQKTQCIVGTDDVKVVEGLPKSQVGTLVAKRPSVKFGTPLDVYLKKYEPERIIVLGAETNVGILFTCYDLRMQGYNVLVYEPLVASKDEYLHNSAISTLVDSLGVEIRGEVP